MSLEQIGLQAGSGALVGYITGWGLKKLLRIVIKIIAIISAAFFAGLVWLEMQRIITVNWASLESQTRNSIGYVVNATTNLESGHTLTGLFDNLGISLAAPMGVAFISGLMKG